MLSPLDQKFAGYLAEELKHTGRANVSMVIAEADLDHINGRFVRKYLKC